MTRKQLMERRKKRRRMQRIRTAVKAGVYALLAVGIFCLVWFVIRPLIQKNKGTEKTAEASQLTDSADTTGDTATKQELDDVSEGSLGWNLDDTGWWFKNEDDTKFVSGWKTIDGQKYYFLDTGYTATGWTYIEANDADSYFDESGVYQPDKKQKLVAVTFDDGPSWDTDSILNTLTANHAKATFFVVGQMAEQDSKTKAALKKELSTGMEVGSHTYEHRILSKSTAEEIQTTMDKNDQVISDLTGGYVPPIMRPTGGGVNDTVSATVTKPMILWDIDTLDWKTKDPAQTIKAATTDIKDGSVILMHDIYKQTAEAVETIVPTLRKQGYKLVTVSELAKAYGYTLEGGKSYYDFYPQTSESGSDTADSFQTIDDSVPTQSNS